MKMKEKNPYYSDLSISTKIKTLKRYILKNNTLHLLSHRHFLVC